MFDHKSIMLYGLRHFHINRIRQGAGGLLPDAASFSTSEPLSAKWQANISGRNLTRHFATCFLNNSYRAFCLDKYAGKRTKVVVASASLL
jgi:hypothetical protein